MTSWAAPTATGPIDARVDLPGSKSITNRALVLAALAQGPSTICGTLRSRDTNLMLAGLSGLGVDVVEDPDDPTTLTLTPAPLHHAHIDCGLAGTVMRFLPAVAAQAVGEVTFDGDEQARSRPLNTILDALTTIGVDINGTSLPFTVAGRGSVAGGTVQIDASGSSQFVSGLLLSAARFERGLRIDHVGAPVPSMPHIEMTIEMLATAGVQVTRPAPNSWQVAPSPIAAVDWSIEPDLSNAAAFLAAAAVNGGTVRVPRWPAQTTQAGARIAETLAVMGCTVDILDGELVVNGPQQLSPVTLDLHDIGELTPTIAALCAFADGESVLSGIAHLRGHETDRLAALTTELNRLGGDCTETEDGLRIRPATLHGGTWQSYADHRMATAGALIGLAVPAVTVDDIETTSKTLPDFPSMWDTMLDGVRSTVGSV